ncbi:MAG TPA: hypothetical protein VL381_10240 [Rhodocyclaceae bacterium]|jgi:hypothetical protein|nr:hypothetical protein [Rhodocyclaceae bacterium]
MSTGYFKVIRKNELAIEAAISPERNEAKLLEALREAAAFILDNPGYTAAEKSRAADLRQMMANL